MTVIGWLLVVCDRAGRHAGRFCGARNKCSGSEEVGQEVFLAALVGLEGLGAADDLHDLGGDGVLAGPVHDAGELGLEVFGVVGGRLHGPLAGGVLGGRRVEQGREHAALDVARQQRLEDLGRAGLVLEVGRRAGRLARSPSSSTTSGRNLRITASCVPTEMNRV